VLAGAGAAATPAHAAPRWLAPTDLSTAGRDAEDPQVAVDPAGDAIAVWTRFDGIHTIVQAAVRQAGGSWVPSGDLSVAGRDAEEPDVAIDAAGNAVAVWRRHNGSKYIVQSATRPAGGAWQGPVDLSAAGETAKEPRVAVDAAGDAVAVWTRFDGLDFVVQAAARPAGGAWQGPLDLSAAGQNAEEPRVAIASAANAVALWSRYDGSRFVVQSARRLAGVWEKPLDVSVAGQNAEEPQLALDPAGDAVAVWSRFDGAKDIVQAAVGPGGAAWGAPADLSEAGQNAEEPQVAVDPAGNAVAIWTRRNSPTDVVQSSSRPAGGNWVAAVPLSVPGDDAEAPQVSLDPDGNAIAVWSRTDATPRVIQGAERPAGGGWLPIALISVVGQSANEPQVASDSVGNAVAVWAREDGANTIVQAAGHDGRGPELRSLLIPAAGTVRQVLAFSVSPFDVWSAIGPARWDFGDEAGGGGNVVTHRFDRPGTYPVTVTAADDLGNSSAASGSVRIYPKPSAARNVRVRHRKGLLRLRCPSPAGCEGALRLIAAVEVGRGERKATRRRRIGRADFEIPGAATTTVRVPIIAKGRAAAAAAGRRGLKAQLTGPGVKHRIVVLYLAKRQTQR
jgi:PKD domain-containing protein